MSTTHAPETQAPGIPDWFKDMEFCHIVWPEDAQTRLCGSPRKVNPETGEFVELHTSGDPFRAICPACQRVKCPRCVQLWDLQMRLAH